MTFKKQWNEYEKKMIEDNFGKDAELIKHKEKAAFDAMMFIIKSITDLLDDEQLTQIPFTMEYSSKGMSEFQDYIYRIEQTNKLLFPSGENFFSTLIFDEYNINHGLHGLHLIIDYFVKWNDTKKREVC